MLYIISARQKTFFLSTGICYSTTLQWNKFLTVADKLTNYSFPTSPTTIPNKKIY